MADIVAKCRTGRYALSISCDPYSREHGLRLPYSDKGNHLMRQFRHQHQSQCLFQKKEGKRLNHDNHDDEIAAW